MKNRVAAYTGLVLVATPPSAAKGLVYTGRRQVGVGMGAGYVLSGTFSAADVGSYVATATLSEGYSWPDGTADALSVPWSISKAANPMTATAKKATVKYSKLKKKARTASAIKVSSAQGELSYKLVKVSAKKKLAKQAKKKIKVGADGKIKLGKKLKKGTYKLTVEVTAAGNGSYEAAAKTVQVTIKVK